MKKFLIALAAVLSGTMLVATSSEAARLGGGRTSGIQRSYTPPAARPSVPQAPPAAQPQQPPVQPAPASGLSRWLPALGGLALGGLLGSMFGGGLGGGLGGILMMALLAIGVVLILRMVMRSRQQSSPPMQFSGTGRETARMPIEIGSQLPQSASDRNPAVAGPIIPAGFDVEGFLRPAKRNFMQLQVANDAGDLESIRELTTPDMFEELKKDILARGGRSQTTDVVTVDADLADVATEGDRHYASVRFSGYVREEPGTPPKPFTEVWHLVKPADGSTGWLLAGIRQEQS